MLGHLRHQTALLLAEPRRARRLDRRLPGAVRRRARRLRRRHRPPPPGPPTTGWEDDHVSAYASVHPWEDWAETFAHYVHIRDTIQTAGAFGIRMADPEVDGARVPVGAASPRAVPDDTDFDAIVSRGCP